jgi:sugar lactone lactonase YvrE
MRIIADMGAAMHHAFRLCTLLVLLLTAACAAPGEASFRPGSVVWPSAPLPPRLALSAVIRTPEDAGIKEGIFATLWSALAGAQERFLARPYGVYADAGQRLVVVDTQLRGVHLFDRENGSYRFVQGGGGVSFMSPIGVTGDGDGRLYISDSAAGAVYRLDPRSLVVEPFVKSGLARPTGIAYNATNRLLYVSDTLAAQVVAFDLAGREVLRFGGEGREPGRFNRPTDLAVDRRGRILVTDPLNGRVQIFSSEGVFLKGFGELGDSSGHFARPKGVATDNEGHIYVCDALFDAVQVFNEEGELLLSFGGGGGAPGEFWMPSGIYVDKDDTVYVADTYNKRIQTFTTLWQGWGE